MDITIKNQFAADILKRLNKILGGGINLKSCIITFIINGKIYSFAFTSSLAIAKKAKEHIWTINANHPDIKQVSQEVVLEKGLAFKRGTLSSYFGSGLSPLKEAEKGFLIASDSIISEDIYHGIPFKSGKDLKGIFFFAVAKSKDFFITNEKLKAAQKIIEEINGKTKSGQRVNAAA